MRAGTQSGKEGKRELVFDEYLILARYSLINQCLVDNSNRTKQQARSRHPTELHLFATLGWNLCAGVDTSSHVHINHVDWNDDALIVGVGKSKKNYQETLQDFRIHAGNPFQPEICAVLSLAIRCACNLHIFNDKLACEALHILRVASHSIRKGAIFLVTTGTVDFVQLLAAVIRLNTAHVLFKFY